MSATYSANLNLAKPAYGDRNWHSPLNANVDILDAAVGTKLNADGSWKNGSMVSSATLIVAASNSKDAKRADYQCDGVDDQVQINAALAALPALAQSRGSVFLMEGNYVLSAPIKMPSYTKLYGHAWSACITLATNANCNMLEPVNAATSHYCAIEDLYFYGNKANQGGAGPYHGITENIGSTAHFGGDLLIRHCLVIHTKGDCLRFDTGSIWHLQLLDNCIEYADANGLTITGTPAGTGHYHNHIIMGNQFRSNVSISGAVAQDINNIIFEGNEVSAGNYNVIFDYCNKVKIVGNELEGILYLKNGDYWIVNGNNIAPHPFVSAYIGVFSCKYLTITGNNIGTYIQLTTSDHITITGNQFGDYAFGVYWPAGDTSDYVTITGNNWWRPGGALSSLHADTTMIHIEVEYRDSAAPTTGHWPKGAICWNSTPAAAQTPGWICTTAGEPGTWKAMANLAT